MLEPSEAKLWPTCRHSTTAELPKVVGDMHCLLDIRRADNKRVVGTFQNRQAPTAQSVGWLKFLAREGGTEWDAIFTAASAQVFLATRLNLNAVRYRNFFVINHVLLN